MTVRRRHFTFVGPYHCPTCQADFEPQTNPGPERCYPNNCALNRLAPAIDAIVARREREARRKVDGGCLPPGSVFLSGHTGPLYLPMTKHWIDLLEQQRQVNDHHSHLLDAMIYALQPVFLAPATAGRRPTWRNRARRRAIATFYGLRARLRPPLLAAARALHLSTRRLLP